MQGVCGQCTPRNSLEHHELHSSVCTAGCLPVPSSVSGSRSGSVDPLVSAVMDGATGMRLAGCAQKSQPLHGRPP